jgi:hypothetical protein
MPVDTRRTQYSIPDLPDDTDMDESPKALALPAPTTPEHPAGTAVQVIAPDDHHTPTTIHAYNPPSDLESIIASIPAPVHISNVQFNVQQYAPHQGGPDLARI